MVGRKTAALTIVAAILFVTALTASDTAREQTLQKAIDLLESKGDLKHAMPLFEEVAKSSDRALAARGLFYLAECQQRQGIEGARGTYERIVREFGNQVEAVEAQKRLAALGVQLSDKPSSRVVMSDVDSDGSLSADGRSMAITDWDSGDIAIQDVATGRINRLMAKTGTYDDSKEYGEWAILSPDRTKVVFLWDPENKDGNYQLRSMVNQPGAKPVVLIQLNDETQWISCGAWFPDGKSVLLQTETGDGIWQFERLSVADHSRRILTSLKWRLGGVQGCPSISPDGKFIAFSALATNPSKRISRGTRPTPPDSADQYIYVLPTDGSGAESVVARSSGINESPVWTPDSHILFISDRSLGAVTGTFGLWSVEVLNGKLNGSASPIWPEIGRITPKGMTSSGTYYYVWGQSGRDVFTAELLTGSLKLRSLPKRLTDNSADLNAAPAWSPDGLQVAFERKRLGTGPGTGIPASVDLVVRTVATGQESVHQFNGDLFGIPVWLGDGKRLLVRAQSTSMGSGIIQIDLRTGQVRSIETISHSALPAGIVSFAISRNNKALYLVIRENSKANDGVRHSTNRIVEYDLGTGDEKQIYTTSITGDSNHGISIAVSPDGRALAIVGSREGARSARLGRINIDGSGYVDLGPAAGINPLVWTPDGRGILFRTDDPSKKNPIVRISSNGGPIEITGLNGSDIDFSPDGSHIVFMNSTGSSDLMAFDNLMSRTSR